MRRSAMTQALVDDDLWTRIEPLLPKRKHRNRRYAGRKPIPDRAVLTGILFVLRSGIPWNMLPREMGCGSGSTCWRRLARWQRAGVWKRLHRALLTELRRRGQLDLARAVVDSASLRALRGGKKLDRTLPIAVRPGRNIMFLPTPTGLRLSRASRRRTGPTGRSCCRWCTPFRPGAGVLLGRCESRGSCKATADTIRSRIGTNSRGAGSPASWRNADGRTAAGWGAHGGWSSARWRGCIDFVASTCDTNGVRAFMKRFSPWPALWCVGTISNRSVNFATCSKPTLLHTHEVRRTSPLTPTT